MRKAHTCDKFQWGIKELYIGFSFISGRFIRLHAKTFEIVQRNCQTD